MTRLRVLVLFGGRSGEHEVSVSSARTVAAALAELGHDPVFVGITRAGRWVRADPHDAAAVPEASEPYVFAVDPTTPRDIDVVFPVMHGPHGEDGTVQGFCELADVAYVGASPEGSVIGVNKALAKRLLDAAGLPIVDHVAFARRDWAERREDLHIKIEKLGWPCFLKPARLGSSVGISRVTDADGIEAAVERALRHDDLVLAEATGGDRELEIGVLEDPDGTLHLSAVGEVVPENAFYDYEAKYRGEETELRIPAPLEEETLTRLQDLARRSFTAISCEGMARIDFFLDASSGVLRVNELNTIPGLTGASMFPRLWEASGVPFSAVVERLLVHARSRHEHRRRLEGSRVEAHSAEVGRPR